MNNFFYRTESIHKDKIFDLFVESPAEREIINDFKSPSHVVLEGSRGSGKSFLMRIAQSELQNNFEHNGILPIYVTFMQSSLIHSSDPNQFFHWMLAKILKESLKTFQKNGLIVSNYAHSLIKQTNENKLDELIMKFETSYKKPNISVDTSNLPEISDVIDVIEEVCEENNIKRLVYFFDEAAHVFRPEQQRQFFTLFRDFKSPYISCNAAVYPGVTHYGSSFEMTHDALHKIIDRNISSPNYLSEMEEMVLKQGGDDWKRKISNQKELFNTLIYCAGGNPRILLKTLDKLEKMNTTSVNELIRNFYRSEIWSEHTQLGEKYKGHKEIIDWGRSFIEDNVIPSTITKNEKSSDRKTIFFWVSKDVPEIVNEALRLLSYTGIIRKVDSGVKATKSKIGSRYEIKFGCVLAQYSNPTTISKELILNLKVDFVTEFGQNNSLYSLLINQNIKDLTDREFLTTLNTQLKKSIKALDLTAWQKSKLDSINITTIQDLLNIGEDELINKLYQVGEVRARIMKNSAISELLETISG